MPLAPALGGRQAQPTVAPIQIIEAQAGELARPQSQSRQTEDHRVIAFAQQPSAVKSLQQLFELRAAQVYRQLFSVMARDGRQRRAQIPGMTSRHAKKSAERPQCRRQRLQLSGWVVLALLKNKVQQNLGCQLAQWQPRSFGLELRIQKQANKERPLLAGACLEPGNVD
jgi:hypothetical protein